MKETAILILTEEKPTGPLIILGLKKTGFGKGKYAAIGGKIEPGETPSAAVLRELREETGLSAAVQNIRAMGEIFFNFQHNPQFNLHTYVFACGAWEGEPAESDELIPCRFKITEIPYHQMWPDSLLWLPLVLAGQKINCFFSYDQNFHLIEKKITITGKR